MKQNYLLSLDGEDVDDAEADDIPGHEDEIH
jgi:hypothetical protein